MFKKSSIRVASVLTVLCLILTCAVCGSVANYTSTTTGSDSVNVAKWQFEVNDMNFATTTPQTMAFDLFGTINEEDTVSTEADVHADLIAPGTGGSFALKIENNSQVNAKYTIALTETNTNGVYIQYSLDKTTWDDDFTTINGTLTDRALNMDGGTETITIYWRWCFDGTTTGAHSGQTNTADTALGILAQTTAPSVAISATLTATQVN